MIHENAIVSKDAKIGKNVTIGPFSIIGNKVNIGDNVEISRMLLLKERLQLAIIQLSILLHHYAIHKP